MLLLHDARRRSDKRNAKRIANRKSASTSRARKKALVKEMTELNARLKRQAMILALLPDLVVVMDLQGEITFCSAQVERILQHNVDQLVGQKLYDILVPSSKERLQKLVHELSTYGGKDLTLSGDIKKSVESNPKIELLDSKGSAEDGARFPMKVKSESRGRTDRMTKSSIPMATISSVPMAKDAVLNKKESGTGATSDSSTFPLSVVNVETSKCLKPSRIGSSDETSDRSGNDGDSGIQPSSLTASASSGISDGHNANKSTPNKNADSSKDKNNLPSSDLSNSSSNVTDIKNLENANANLERNVRWHNKKIKNIEVARSGYNVDDVHGENVTANNASARLSSLLSSLQNRAESIHNSSSSSDEGDDEQGEDDSGYRESNDSREADTSSSEWESKSDSNGT